MLPLSNVRGLELSDTACAHYHRFAAPRPDRYFCADAKANPGKIIMASVGNGTTPQMTGELFKMMAQVDLLSRAIPRCCAGSD